MYDPLARWKVDVFNGMPVAESAGLRRRRRVTFPRSTRSLSRRRRGDVTGDGAIPQLIQSALFMAHDRMQRRRFEFKYVVNEDLAQAIRVFTSGHLELDESGVGQPHNAYRVNSIYLDSNQFHTFEDWANANSNRFKLRMRFYDVDPDTPVFLETKRRVGTCILKQRCGIRKAAAPLILAGQFPPHDLLVSPQAKAHAALEHFLTLTCRLQAKPKALTTYLREAYIAPNDPGVRVTLDREVRIAPRHTLDFDLRLPQYVQPFGDRVILELKFNNRFPGWFREMIQNYNLREGGAAKYCEGVAAIWKREHRHWFGRTRPPAAANPAIGERRDTRSLELNRTAAAGPNARQQIESIVGARRD